MTDSVVMPPCGSCEAITRTTPFVLSAFVFWQRRSLPVGATHRRTLGVLGGLLAAGGLYLNLVHLPLSRRL